MTKQDLNKIVRKTKTALAKQSPAILTGVGIAGMAGTVIFAVKVTPKAMQLIEEEKKEQEADSLHFKDVIRATWKCYIPVVAMGLTSAGCLIGANSVNSRRNAALATAYNLSRTALSEYKEQVIETIGEKKEKAIQEKVIQKKVENNPPSNSEVVITGKGNLTLCYDGVFGRYFKSDIDAIKKAINAVNRRVVVYGYCALNDFYAEVGLNPIEVGDDLGWNVDDGEIDVNFGSGLAPDGTPYLAIYYNVSPQYNYSTF